MKYQQEWEVQAQEHKQVACQYAEIYQLLAAQGVLDNEKLKNKDFYARTGELRQDTQTTAVEYAGINWIINFKTKQAVPHPYQFQRQL